MNTKDNAPVEARHRAYVNKHFTGPEFSWEKSQALANFERDVTAELRDEITRLRQTAHVFAEEFRLRAKKAEADNAKLLNDNVEANGRLDMQMKELAKLRAELAAAKANAERLITQFESIEARIPAYNEGELILVHHDGNGNETGVESVDPVAVVICIAGALRAAIDAARGAKGTT